MRIQILLTICIWILLAACSSGEDDPAVETLPTQVSPEPTATHTPPPTETPDRTVRDPDIPLKIGGIAEGQLIPNATQTWTLNIQQPAVTQFNIKRLSGTLSLSIKVLDNQDTLLNQFEMGDLPQVLTTPIQFAQAGTYTIALHSGDTEGTYQIHIQAVEGQEVAIQPTQSPTSTRTEGPTFTPSLTFTPTLNAYEMTAQAVTPTPTTEGESPSGGIEILAQIDESGQVVTFVPEETVATQEPTEEVGQNTPPPTISLAESDPSEGTETTSNVEVQERLEIGQTVENEITQAGETHRYTFFGTANQTVSLIVNRAPQNGGALDPAIEVQAPNGELFAQANDMLPDVRDALIRNAELPTTGVYTIYVKSADEINTGRYLLSLSDGFTLRDVERGEAAYNAPNEQTLETYGARDIWTIELKAGDTVSIAVEAVDPEDELDVMAELAAPDGSICDDCFDNDSGGNRNAFLSGIEAPATGTYQIRVAARNNASVGDYRLWWRRDDDIPPTPKPLTATPLPTPVPPTDTIEGAVAQNDIFQYQIQADALQDVNIVVQGLGNFDPVLRVTDPLGNVVIEVDDVGSSQDPRARFVAEPSGLYQIEVFGFEGMAGSFSLNYIVQ